MSRTRRSQRSPQQRWTRRIRQIAIVGGVAAVVMGARRMLLDRDQVAFDERYGQAP